MPAPATLQQVGFGLILIYVFLLFSRLQDFIAGAHIPFVLLTLCGLAALASGSLLAGVNSKVGFCLLAFTLCTFFSVPLSVWRGGAAHFILNRWIPLVALFFATVALVRTIRHVYLLMSGITLGICTTSLLSFVAGGKIQGRLVMDTARFGDPNELAQVMLTGMCLLLVVRKPSRMGRLLVSGAGVLLFLTFIRTGSRGGLVGLLVALASLLVLGKSRVKIVTAVAGVVLVLGGIALAPASLRARYLYVFGMADDQSTGSSDAAGESSAAARKYLLERSIELTILNPLVGVGTGMFAVAENGFAQSEGMSRGMWHDTHNMFTQVSSENGIPALILFVAMFAISLHRLSAINRKYRDSSDPRAPAIVQMAFGLRITILAYLGVSFFLSSAYTEITVLLLALTLALDRAVRSEFSYAVPQPELASFVPARAGAALPAAETLSDPVAVGTQQVSSAVYRLRGTRRPSPARSPIPK